MRKKIYISLPITGYDEAERRGLADLWAGRLQAFGFNYVNPFEIYDELVELETEVSYEDILRADLHALSRCDGMLVLGNWEKSEGCKTEIAIAELSGIAITYVK